MAEGIVQVAPDSTGKKVRTEEITVGANLVEQQVISVATSTGTLIDDLSRSSVTQPVSAASLPLPAGAATEAGHLAAIDTATARIPAQGQALAAASVPVVLTAAQQTALTPPPAITGYALDSTVAKDGTDITTPSPAMPAGGVGIRGWLSAIWTKLNASIAVTGTFWQTTQPVSIAATVSDDVTDRAARLLGHVVSDTGSTTAVTALPALPAGTNVIGHVIVDTAPAVTGTVTSNQGTANATPWNENLAQVGGAAVTQGQKAAASSIPVVLPNDANGATQASALYHQGRVLNTYTATYRLAARPYALSFAMTAGLRKQYATIHHLAAATKTVKLKRVELALESSSAASILVADLVRITAAPATGNPAITPTPQNPGNTAVEATCLALPTTAGTEGALHSMQEWNLGITGTGSVINPPPGLNWYTLWPQTQGASEAQENQFPTIRAGVLEGFAVTIDASAAATVKGYVVIEFTEE